MTDEVRPSASRIVSGPLHWFGPFSSGVIVTGPERVLPILASDGKRAGSAKPAFTCAPSQKGLSED